LLVTLGTLGLLVTLSLGLAAQEADDLLRPFTQAELDNNWAQDRTFPTGDVTSVTFDGRTNVAAIGIDSTQAAVAPFNRTEGIQSSEGTNTDGTFGDAVQIDLYLDPAWAETAVRTGIWVFDGSHYGIIEFTNLEHATGGDEGTGWEAFEGFRVWDSNIPGQWRFLTTGFTPGEWVTLRVELDAASEVYRYLINGQEVGTGVSGGPTINQVILNSYNFGANTFVGLNVDSYTARYEVGALPDPIPPEPPGPPANDPPLIPPGNLAPGDQDPNATVTTRNGQTPLPGEPVIITLSGFAPEEWVFVRLYPGHDVGWVQANAAGRAVAHDRLPITFEFGEHHVVGQGESGSVAWNTFDVLGPSFIDVAANNPFALSIAWMERSGITKGCNPPANTMFCPTDSTTRGQMAAFFTRGLTLAAAPDQGFLDIASTVFVDAINSIAADGITFGCNPPANTLYCPSDLTTRGQMAAFFVRALGLPPAGDQGFTDIGGSVFVDAINSLAEANITFGCNPPANDNYCPDDPITRQQMAAFFRRALGEGALGVDPN
jgi:hypothetical protein